MFAQLPSDARNGGSTLVSLIGTQMPRKYKIALPNVNTVNGLGTNLNNMFTSVNNSLK